MNFKFIFLIGMPAVGKSFWGREIAAAHSLQFTDLDVLVAKQEQASIPALFASYGENGFRKREQKWLQNLIQTAACDTVVATGGGTPCFAENMELMKAHGTVIYLEADSVYLMHNLKKSDEIRPMLKNLSDTQSYLDGLLQKRKKIYGQAHHILPAKDISLTTFAEIIATCISRH